MFASGQRPDLIFKLLRGLRPHAARMRREDKSEEGITLAVGSDACLLRTQLQAEVGQNPLNRSQRSFSLRIGLAEDDKVIGVTNKVETLFVQGPIHVIEDDVSEQGRENTSLGSADGSRLEDTGLHHTGSKKFIDKTKDVAVSDFSSDRLHNNLEGEIIEEALNVSIKDNEEASTVEVQSAVNGHVAIALRTKTEGGVVEQRFEDRGEETTKDLLSNPIANGRNAERTKLRIVLRNESPAKRERAKRAVLQIAHKGVEIVGEVSFEHLDADLVDARCPPITLDRFEGGKH